MFEKSRICADVSYNIFNILCDAPDDVKCILKLNDVIPTSSNRAGEFYRIDNALGSFDFDDVARMNVYKVIAAIIFMKKIDFGDCFNTGDSIAAITGPSLLFAQKASDLLGLSITELTKILTFNSIRVLNKLIE